MEMPEATVESTAYWWPRGVRWPEIQGDPKLVGIGTTVEVVTFTVSWLWCTIFTLVSFCGLGNSYRVPLIACMCSRKWDIADSS